MLRYILWSSAARDQPPVCFRDSGSEVSRVDVPTVVELIDQVGLQAAVSCVIKTLHEAGSLCFVRGNVKAQ